ncbi:hypothetical protein [Nocardia xishanensis]|uniref:hypothetical protein n=1 Tax=Nocardia xishanensis TaxID=238964 RepID=UPI0035A25836
MELAEQAIDICRELDTMRDDCEHAAVTLLALQAPVACELRRVVTASSSPATSLEWARCPNTSPTSGAAATPRMRSRNRSSRSLPAWVRPRSPWPPPPPGCWTLVIPTSPPSSTATTT